MPSSAIVEETGKNEIQLPPSENKIKPETEAETETIPEPEKMQESETNAETDPETRTAYEEKYQKKAALLQKQNAAYNQFCEDNGLKKQHDRISITKWNRSEAAKARAAAKRYNEDKE
jgi:hypothetical protein